MSIEELRRILALDIRQKAAERHPAEKRRAEATAFA
jgi:hypothetical protein